MTRNADRDVDPLHGGVGVSGMLVATSLVLGVSLLWARTYEQSCVALVSPGLVGLAVFWGLLEYRLERRRFAVDYYLDRGSSWRRPFRRAVLPAVIAMAAALPLVVVLAVFAALARATDWVFLAAAAVLAPFLFDRLSVWPGGHLRRDAAPVGGGRAAEILTARVAGRLVLALAVLAYVYFNYAVIAGPAHVFPGSVELTIEAFAGQVRSACPVVERGLSAVTWFDSVGWHLMAVVAAGSDEDAAGFMAIAWAVFFANAALAMAGFVRGCEGAVLATLRAGRWGARRIRRDAAAQRGSRGVAWAKRARRGALALVPLTVLAATGVHMVQQGTAERWREAFRAAELHDTRQVIDDRVEVAFAPVYAAIPDLLDRHYSALSWWDALTSLVGEDKSLIEELRRRVDDARGTAVDQVDGEMREEALDGLERSFSRDVASLPRGLGSVYERLLKPTLQAAMDRLGRAIGPGSVADAMEDGESTFEQLARPSPGAGFDYLLRGAVPRSSREGLGRALTALVEAEKGRAKGDLLRAVETVRFSALGDFTPSRLAPTGFAER